ncbi:MAG: adenosylcobinamide-phosphate synthase CbiB [Anaerovibrio sp.]|nr:adenosylcobinamide-phosphate synthase CbiB [Anaerovibrio sp.]
MLTAVFAFLADTLLGDPRSRWHPVVLIGRLISSLEQLLYHEGDSDRHKLAAGGLLAVTAAVLVYYVTDAVLHFVSLAGSPYLTVVAEAVLLSFAVSPKSLAEAGREIYGYLQKNDMENARYKVGWIVGRDTDKLSSEEVTRAAVETIAENTVDGIIAPFFFFLLGGVPLAFLYRTVNTLDSMVGYKNDKYLYFGRVSARLDDVLNYIPARITGLLFVLSAFFLGFDWRKSWQILRRDAARHPSPNGGWAEASVAGALKIRLGGFNSYFGRESFRAYMGEPEEKLAPRHIMACIRLMYTATVLFLLLAHCLQQLYLLYGFWK